MHYLVGISGYHATERDARGEAMRHARTEFAKYTGVEVTELDEISRVIYGKTSSILDPTVVGKSQSTHETDALVRRTRAKEWYFEKLNQSCRGTNQGIAFQYWVLAEVPSEEFDKIQEWKTKRELAKADLITTGRKEAEAVLKRSADLHRGALVEVEALMTKGDPISALEILQTDWNRLYDAGETIASKGNHLASVVEDLHALQREIPADVQRIRSSLIIDAGRQAMVWIPTGNIAQVEIQAWVWIRRAGQIVPASAIPLLLKKKDGTKHVSQEMSDPNGELVFRVERIEPGEYRIALDTESGALALLNPQLKQAMAAVENNLTVSEYTPNISGGAKAGVQQLFGGPSFKPLPVKTVVMGSARYGETRHGSPFGRRLEKEIEQEITKITSVTFIRRQDKRNTRSLSHADQARGIGMLDRPQQSMNSPAIQAVLDGADASLEASYVVEGGAVKIDMRLIQARTGKSVAAISVGVDKALIPNDLQLIPSSMEDFQMEMGSLKTGDIALELTTQRGDGATFAEGEKIIYYVSSSQDAYLLLLYRDADGNVIQIFPNSRSGEGFRSAGEYMAIPDETDVFDFDIRAPFGVEQVWAFAATRPFPTLKGKNISSGLTVLKQGLSEVMSILRSQGKKNGVSYGEANVVVTTVKE